MMRARLANISRAEEFPSKLSEIFLPSERPTSKLAELTYRTAP